MRMFLPVGSFPLYGFFDWSAVGYFYLRELRKRYQVKAISTAFSDMRGWDALHSNFTGPTPENYINVVVGPVFKRFYEAYKVNVAIAGGWPIPHQDLDDYDAVVLPNKEHFGRTYRDQNLPWVVAPPARLFEVIDDIVENL